MGPRTLHRPLSMYTVIHNLPSCAQLADVEKAVEKWEEQLLVYKRCGGVEMPEHEKIWIIMKMLPLLTPNGFPCFAELCQLGSVEK